MLKQKMVDLLYELMKNSKRSDRELAKVIGVSQPTVTRMRKNLERQRYIYGYTIVPALEKIGFEILALNFLSIETTDETIKEFKEWTTKNSEVIFLSLGEGLNDKNLAVITLHNNFSNFSSFIYKLRKNFGSKITTMDSFLCSLKTGVLKHLSLKDLKKPS